MQAILRWIQKEAVLTASGLLALLSFCFVPISSQTWEAIDLRVLSLLFCLMGVMAGLQQLGIFARLGHSLLKTTTGTRRLSSVLVLLCFFTSMLITNDVALITFVPFAILVLSMAKEERLLIPTVVLQTVAANLGSMLTPVGNPQNLYLFSRSGMDIGAFLHLMFPYWLASLALLATLLALGPRRPLALTGPAPEFPAINRRKLAAYLALFGLALATVLHGVDYPVTLAVTLLYLLLADRGLFSKIDYSLLLTFVFFFLFVGNLERIPAVSQWLAAALGGRELWVSAAVSQVISNVPAALLLSGFTENFPALIKGTNLGGLGTLIASLASLISYKYYVRTPGSRKGRYLLVFTGYNALFLAVLLLLSLLL